MSLRKIASGSPTGSDLFRYLVVYPFLIRALYLIRQSWEPLYMNATCLIDLVRVSSPEHYKVHPLWSHYQKSSNVTCEDLTGKSMDEYFKDIYGAGEVEFKIFYFCFLGYGTYCGLKFLKQLVYGRVKSFIGLLAAIILAWNHFSIFHLLAHYQNDCSHVNGNVMHHSSYTVNDNNAALVDTLPPGLIINFSLNFFTTISIFYVVMEYFGIDSEVYFNVLGPVAIGKMILQMKVIHPFIHQNHTSWFKSVFGENFPYDEYEGHVNCHHVSGFCLGDAPTYAWFYNELLRYHGKVFEAGLIRFQQVEYYIANIALDYVLLASVLFFTFITVLVMYPLLDRKTAVTDKATAAKKVK